MSNSVVDRRYAGALVEICDERGDHTEVTDAFDRVVAVLREVPEALAMLANPTVHASARESLLESLIERCGAEGEVGNLLRLLFARGRIAAVPGIHARFREELDGRTGRIQARVVSADALTPDALGRIQAALRGDEGREVTLATAIDEDLIGGFVVRVGNIIYDASIRNHLQRLRERMLAGTHG